MNIAILSDVHGNICALDSVLSDIKSLDVSEIVFLGDLVISGPSPSEVIQKMRSLKTKCWIKGNTDDWFAEINDEWSPTTPQEENLYKLFLYAQNRLDKDSINFLIELPETYTFETAGVSILAVHGSPRSYSEGIGKDFGDNLLKTIISNIKEKIIVSGHTHVPFIGEIAKKTIFNVGSIGIPFDGDNRASYGIIEIKNEIPKCSIRRVPYPISETIAIAKDQGFPDLNNFKKKLKKARV